MDIEQRARIHRALGDAARLRIVEELTLADRSPAELGDLVGLHSNLLAHHLGVLEESGLLRRRPGEGDRRRRYLSLQAHLLDVLVPTPLLEARSVLFVCTHNSARSKFAEAVLKQRLDIEVQSAGTFPARSVHAKARVAAAEMGFALSAEPPRAYPEVRGAPDLVISVCDRAREASMPFGAPSLHWSIPDPVDADRIAAFRAAFVIIEDRVDQLVDALQGGSQS